MKLGDILSLLATTGSHAQINYAGGTYSENFDGLLNSGSALLAGAGTIGTQATVPGVTAWQAVRVGGTAVTAISIFADIGTATTGRFCSYVAASSTERALGAIGSGRTWGGFVTAFLNAGSETYDSITIRFNHEIWAVQGTTSATSKLTDALVFAYGLPGGSITPANFLTSGVMNAVSALDATSPSSNEINGVVDAVTPPRNVDGNSATYQQLVTATISGLNWSPSQTLFIRWQDSDTGGFDAGHGVDDFTKTATPVTEPSILALLGIGLVALMFLRARRSYCNP